MAKPKIRILQRVVCVIILTVKTGMVTPAVPDKRLDELIKNKKEEATKK